MSISKVNIDEILISFEMMIFDILKINFKNWF